jgi:hypothetical protein
MTNASVKNLLFGISVVAIAAALSLGAFATSVHADIWESYDSFGGGWDSYDSFGSWDSYDSLGGWYSYDSVGGWDSYDSIGDWYSYDSYNPGYYEYDSYNPGYYEYDSYNPGYYEYDSYNPGYEEYYEDFYVNEVFKEQYQPMTFAKSFVPPQFQQFLPQPPKPQPPMFYPPQQPPRPQPPAPQPPIFPPAPQPPVTNNNCVNNSCNVNTNTNVNTNVTTVTQATPQPIIQYVAPQYPQAQAPFCVITIGQGYAVGMITLTWSSQGVVTSAYITPSVGQVAPNGSTSLYAYGSTVYSLTVSGPGGTYTCHTQSYVAPSAPVSPYVSLTQIPYTGISMGPIASIAYWTGLIALAIAGAYLLVYYKGGALALATSMISRRNAAEENEDAVATNAETTSHFELPTSESATRDAMKIVRDSYGMPRLVISRS